MMQRNAFTLKGMMACIIIVTVFFAVFLPPLVDAHDTARAGAMATTVHQIRKLIATHAALRKFPRTPEGYPQTIYTDWFTMKVLPYSTWRNMPIVLGTVDWSPDQVYPEVKTFDTMMPNAVSAWYNSSNGAFCALVREGSSDEQTIRWFNLTNSCEIRSLDQMTE